VLHGGFWRAAYDRSLMAALCADLAARGLAAWNLEYRRLGGGGGWPQTFADVAAGVDRLAALEAELDLGRVSCVGHSAGGQLALWAASRRWARVTIGRVVSQAGVCDLAEAARLGLSRGAADELLGGSLSAHPGRLAAASPAARLPLGVPQLLVHGELDDAVPIAMAEAYARAARAAGDDVELVRLPRTGHFEHLDPASEAWRAAIAFLERSASRHAPGIS
jgi:acetyl esterase/lipase